MKLIVKAIEEYNSDGFLIHAANYPGAYVRGKTRECALAKIDQEMSDYLFWKDGFLPEERPSVWVDVIESFPSETNIRDADSFVLFEMERNALTAEEYQDLKALALKSASDFLELYRSIPDKNSTKLEERKTFYGHIPTTAEEMYRHTKDVNDYYFGRIGVKASNDPDIVTCREAAFAALEKQMDYLDNALHQDPHGELWTLRKLLRRFIWHDRIHAKAMYRMAQLTFGKGQTSNPFHFSYDPKKDAKAVTEAEKKR